MPQLEKKKMLKIIEKRFSINRIKNYNNPSEKKFWLSPNLVYPTKNKSLEIKAWKSSIGF